MYMHTRLVHVPVDTDGVIITGALPGALAGLRMPILLQLRVGHQVLVALEGRKEDLGENVRERAKNMYLHVYSQLGMLINF